MLNKLINLTVAVTNKCNSRCKTCKIWQKTDFSKELKLIEYKKIFQNLDKLFILVLTGGEPFLNRQLPKICKYAETYCKPKSIIIPTNCLLGVYVVEQTREILRNCKKSHLTVNISLDGLGKEHDYLRGIEGNFNRAIETYLELKKLEKKYKNFDVSIHTVISKFNYKHFPTLCDYVLDELKPKNYITEIAESRYELDNVEEIIISNPNLDEIITPNLEEYSSAIDYLIKRIRQQKLTLKQKFRLEYYELVKRWLKEKRQIIPCRAGVSSAQISPTGELWFCCVRAESVGNLRDVNYDIKKLWHNKKAKTLRKSIKNKECSCPLASASYTNLLNLKSLIKILLKK